MHTCWWFNHVCAFSRNGSLYSSVCQVNPQFYAFRWITLLLTQEFNFADSLHIWDTLLSDPDGPQVQFIFNLVLLSNGI